jgi:hypothetical protein
VLHEGGVREDLVHGHALLVRVAVDLVPGHLRTQIFILLILNVKFWTFSATALIYNIQP